MSACRPTSASPSRWSCSGAADAVTAARLRRELQRWLRDATEASAEARDDVVLGVHEALANCVEHAYHGRHAAGTMTVQAGHDPVGHSISVCVSDRGSWNRPSRKNRDDPRSSRGITLMRALADHCTIDVRTNGTVVRLDYTYDSLSRHSYAG